MRQIVEALGIKPQFDTESTPQNLSVFTMTEYKKEFPFPVVFPPVIPNNTLAEWLSSKGLAQFHCAGMKNDVYTAMVYTQIFPAIVCLLCRDREICSCDIFLQWRAGEAL